MKITYVDSTEEVKINDRVRIDLCSGDVCEGCITRIDTDNTFMEVTGTFNGVSGISAIPFDDIMRILHIIRSGPTPCGVDMVSHPPHYQSETGLEVIDAIEAFTFDLMGIEAVCTGNVLKYICRWKKKNGVEDLKKAKWYLERLIKHVENLEKENA